MVRVCVVGGGTAGSEAANEAAQAGAEVTIVERLDKIQQGWRTWVDLIRPQKLDSPRGEPSLPVGCESLVDEARSYGQGWLRTSAGHQLRFDSIVLATGSSFKPVGVPGAKVPGVHVLDSPAEYARLGEGSASADKPLIAGEGFCGLKVADRLCGEGRRVNLAMSHWDHGGPSPLVYDVMAKAALSEGVRISMGQFTRAVGRSRVEAAVVDSEAIGCDLLAVVPSRVPRTVPGPAKVGRLGGILVDRFLESGTPGVFAAGGCAEVESGVGPSFTLEAESAPSGRLAGSNCMGGEHAIGASRFNEISCFGLRWTRVGFSPEAARSSSLPTQSVSHSWGPSEACVIVYEKLTGRSIGVETVERILSSRGVALPSSPGVTLQSLAYGGLSSSDISLVSETARLGLKAWQKS